MHCISDFSLASVWSRRRSLLKTKRRHLQLRSVSQLFANLTKKKPINTNHANRMTLTWNTANDAHRHRDTRTQIQAQTHTDTHTHTHTDTHTYAHTYT